MRKDYRVMLFESDQPVLSSLRFFLTLQGFEPEDGDAEGVSFPGVCCVVIDQRYRDDGLGFLDQLRASGMAGPAVLLATNPTQQLRHRTASSGAILIEKPLLGDDLTDALHTFLQASKAA